MSQQTVLIIGSTGNIGVAAVLASLKAGYHVLAIVRSATSAEKLFHHVGTKEGITTVEADMTSDAGVQSVVDQVQAGQLPHFQHVYCCAGGLYGATPLSELSTAELREYMNVNFESNFFAYRATVPYLRRQNYENASWTLCTGAQGDFGQRAAPAISQGALFSMANAACHDTAGTNVRFNEVYLSLRVEVDESAAKTGAHKASNFAKVYEGVLANQDIRGARVIVNSPADFETLRVEQKSSKPYGS